MDFEGIKNHALGMQEYEVYKEKRYMKLINLLNLIKKHKFEVLPKDIYIIYNDEEEHFHINEFSDNNTYIEKVLDVTYINQSGLDLFSYLCIKCRNGISNILNCKLYYYQQVIKCNVAMEAIVI